MRSKKPFFSIVASVLLFMSVAFMLSPLQALVSYAAVSPDKVTAKAFSVPNGTSLPWGTTYNGNGNIWVAMPGCDPNPTCNPTPAGNIAVFDPATSSWKQVINLPSDYSQAFFLAFDKNGNVWFPLPMANSIGKYNIASKQFQRWTVPTAKAGPGTLPLTPRASSGLPNTSPIKLAVSIRQLNSLPKFPPRHRIASPTVSRLMHTATNGLPRTIHPWP